MGTRLYFAYGSNMSKEQMTQRVGAVDARGRAQLRDFAFVLNKRGDDGSGKANIEQRPGETVWGVLYRLTSSQLRRLDSKEKGYRRQTLEVECQDGSESAVTYIAETSRAGLLPTNEYRGLILNGACEHGLPSDYLAQLERVLAGTQARGVGLH
jgi:cation transport regulator ChaC